MAPGSEAPTGASGVRDPAIRRHRRLLPSALFRRFERVGWIGVLVALTVTGVFAVRAWDAGRVRAQLSVRFQPAVTAPATGAPCAFNPACVRPPLAGPPLRVRIAALGVDSTLEDLTLDERGQLRPPVSYATAGWFARGVSPGDAGPAVIAGHVDGPTGPAVFYRLHELHAGDTVDVLRADTWTTFRVTSTEQYAKDQFPAERVYRPTPDAELRLITCGGDFDPGRQSYRDNIVVYAVIA